MRIYGAIENINIFYDKRQSWGGVKQRNQEEKS